TTSQRDRPSVQFEYTREAPLTIDFSTVPVDAGSGRKVFGIPVEQGQLVRDEVLGVSDGSPDQAFPLAHPGLILRPAGLGQSAGGDIAVVTRLGTTIDAWTRRDALAFSEAGQRDYMIRVDADDRATV